MEQPEPQEKAPKKRVPTRAELRRDLARAVAEALESERERPEVEEDGE